ncbi:hypothetical protein TNCV_3862281 [Trichonephila clavipes]|nr:hypothetical protein TNCV_3862281 [Trichonephila clavipes]
MNAANVRSHDAAKYGCCCLEARNRTWIHLKKGHLAIRATRLGVEYIIKDVPACNAASRVDAAMVSEL